MTRADLRIFWSLIVFAAAAGSFAVWKVVGYGSPLSGLALPGWATPFLLGLLLGLRSKGKLGELRQAVRHSLRGVLGGHLELMGWRSK